MPVSVWLFRKALTVYTPPVPECLSPFLFASFIFCSVDSSPPADCSQNQAFQLVKVICKTF